jgi:hypothetical protein
MRFRKVRLTDEAVNDIDAATYFYEEIETGLGQYFFDSMTTDLEALGFFGGIHPQRLGYYCCPAKRFPFLIYYELGEAELFVIAILDSRADPNGADERLGS